jgi:hypothetical protein
MSQDKRHIKVNLEDLKDAFTSGFEGMRHYLDLETGDVVLVTADTRQQLETLLESTGGESIEAVQEAILQEDIPNWQKEALVDAVLVEFGFASHFIDIPHDESHEAYADMEAFIETVPDPHLQDLLQVAIRGKGAFRRFKDVLLDYPQMRERWFQFKDERLRERVLEWLDLNDIDPSL